jgi:hypothetical protein
MYMVVSVHLCGYASKHVHVNGVGTLTYQVARRMPDRAGFCLSGLPYRHGVTMRAALARIGTPIVRTQESAHNETPYVIGSEELPAWVRFPSPGIHTYNHRQQFTEINCVIPTLPGFVGKVSHCGRPGRPRRRRRIEPDCSSHCADTSFYRMTR